MDALNIMGPAPGFADPLDVLEAPDSVAGVEDRISEIVSEKLEHITRIEALDKELGALYRRRDEIRKEARDARS